MAGILLPDRLCRIHHVPRWLLLPGRRRVVLVVRGGVLLPLGVGGPDELPRRPVLRR